jgi:hypothetical protein
MAYNTTAKGLSALGRKGDNTLIHVSKDELAGLQSLLGPVSTNPHTGLPEAFAWKDVLTTALIGITGALTGGAAVAAAPEIGALGSMAVGSGVGALGGGALSASEGKGFGSGALGGAISGGLGGYGGAGSFDAAGVGTDTAGKAGLGKALEAPQVAQNYGTLDTSFTNLEPNILNKVGSGASTYGSGLSQQASAMGSKAGMESLLYPVGTGTALGTAATDMIQQNAAYKKQAEQEQAQADANAQDQQDYFASLGYDLAPLSTLNNPSHSAQRDYYLNILNPPRGAATGGSMNVQIPMGGTPVSFTLPPKYGSMVEKLDIPYEQNEIKNKLGLANGGYVNTQPINPNAFYPQSQIASARPYPASTPQRHEVIQGFEDGGMLDGPGDGMSDDIPANIDGEEEIRLADGEFVVPPDLVRMLGYGDPEKGAKLLDNLLPIVRQAAHGKKTQIKQDAGRLAAEKMLARAAKGKA